MQESFPDAALVLVGHGSTKNAESSAPVFQHAAELRGRRVFAEVREAFWKQQPEVVRVLPELRTARVFIVPMFISEGHFSENIIPQALGFQVRESANSSRARRLGEQTLYYCRPVGSHESMTKVLLARADEVIARFPFPRAPKPKEITLFIAGHGTEQNQESRKAVARQVELIRSMEIYAAVEPLFMEEDPRINTGYQSAQTRNIVIIPFFISDGLHVGEDIPVLLGEPERIVRKRLESGQATWRNPTEKQNKLVWLGKSVGTEPLLAEVILERVREAAAWSPAFSRPGDGKD